MDSGKRIKKTKYTRRADGRIVLTKTIDGKRVSFYGQSDREVEAKLHSYILTKDSKPKKPKCRTFDKVAEDWWEKKESELAVGSVRVYRARVKEIADYFKNTPVDEITPLKIVSYLRRLQAQDYSQKVINNKKSIIKQILDDALIAGDIEMNPCINLPTVKGKSKEARNPASDADIKAIEAHRNDSDIARMVYFILWTGCRRGEAAALQWKHIDFESRTAKICQSVAYSSPTAQVKSPKTEAGERDVILPPNVIEVLQGRQGKPNQFVFFPKGLPKEREFQVAIDDFRKSAGISCTLHQLRHSYATMLHSAGVDVKDAQYLLGHSSIIVTQDIYTALDRDAKSKVALQISQHIQKKGVLSAVLSEPANPHESSTK